jgi:hypothetical protein
MVPRGAGIQGMTRVGLFIAVAVVLVAVLVSFFSFFSWLRSKRLTKRLRQPIEIDARAGDGPQRARLLLDLIAFQLDVNVDCLRKCDRLDKDLWLTGWRSRLVVGNDSLHEIRDEMQYQDSDLPDIWWFLRVRRSGTLGELLNIAKHGELSGPNHPESARTD